jgi:hypothetical protein
MAKRKSLSQLFMRLIRLLKLDGIEIGHIYFYGIISGILSLVLPLGIQSIINFLQTGKVNSSWITISVFVVLSITAAGWFQLMQIRITESLQQRVFYRSAFEFVVRLIRLKKGELKDYSTTERANRFFDTLTIQKGLSKMLIDIPAALIQIVFGLVLLSFYHSFFIAFSLCLIVVLWILFRYTAEKGVTTSLYESKFKYDAASWLQQIAHGTRSHTGLNEKFHLIKTDQILVNYLSSRDSHFKVLAKQYKIMIAFKAITALSLLIIGGLLVINQQMNIGQFIASEIIILLVTSSVEKLVFSLETIYDVLTGLEKIGEITDARVNVAESKPLPDGWRQLELLNPSSSQAIIFSPGNYVYFGNSNNLGKRAEFIDDEATICLDRSIDQHHIRGVFCELNHVVLYPGATLEETLGLVNNELEAEIERDLINFNLVESFRKKDIELTHRFSSVEPKLSLLEKNLLAIIQVKYNKDMLIVDLGTFIDELLLYGEKDLIQKIYSCLDGKVILTKTALKSVVQMNQFVIDISNSNIISNQADYSDLSSKCYA